jgi:hypothetical protein
MAEPSTAKMCGASLANALAMARQRAPSSGDKALARATVASRSALTPNHDPSGKAVAKALLAGAKARP